MTVWICATCGAHFAQSAQPPGACPICRDERQYVAAGGQHWLSRDALTSTHHNDCRELEPGLLGIGITPAIGIGQRALLIQTPAGNVLWDCVPMLDEATATRIEALGGLAAICCSHPHFYTGMAEWSEKLGDVPILLPTADLAFVTRPSHTIVPWGGAPHDVLPGVRLYRLGGHFEGSSVLHWGAGAAGRGALLVGDTMQVTPGGDWVSFMRSYPNLIPLPARQVAAMAGQVADIAFDRIYGGWWDRVIDRGAKAAVARSAGRYIKTLD